MNKKQNYTIAFCDVLGFEQFVQRNDLDVVVSWTNWIFKALYFLMYKSKSLPERTPTLNKLQEHKDIGIICFSDTFLFYTRKDDCKSIKSLIHCIADLLFVAMFTPVKFRCAISYGEAYIDPINSVCIGKPMVEAYKMEKRQEWSGGVLTYSAQKRISNCVGGNNLACWKLVSCVFPLKNKVYFPTLAIDWTVNCHLPISFDENPSPDLRIKYPDVSKKWELTKRFHREVCTSCKISVGNWEMRRTLI